MGGPELALEAMRDSPAVPAATPPQERGVPFGMRTKGWILLAFLFAYLAIMCALLLTRMDATLAGQEALAAQVAAVAALDRERAVLEALSAHPEDAARIAELAQPERLRDAVEAAAGTGPALGASRDAVDALDAGIRAYHSSPHATLEGAASRLAPLASQASRALRDAERDASAALAAQTERFRAEQRNGAWLLVGVGLIGIALLGAAVVAFLSRTVADVRALMGRTSEIVAGHPPRPMPPTRFDELGELSAAIDELAVALQRRERDLELERRKGFHREKMAAIGSLAAGVLTEIGNPIAAIDGLARAMRESQATDAATAAPDGSAPTAILEQTARLMVVTQQVAEFAAPQPSRRELIDVNAVVERALGLLRFDEAMRGIDVELALDRQLGAVSGMTDRLVQLLMNLIGNATDALRQPRGLRPQLRIATFGEDRDVVLQVADNGAGMTDEVRARAFEPFFSTKPVGQGTGLGLPLCQSIVTDHGGRIEVASAAGVGTCVTIRLPLAPPDIPA